MTNLDKADNNITNKNQLNEAFQFIQQKNVETSEKIQKLINDIKYLEENKKEIENNILNLQKLKDKNVELFSPSTKQIKNDQSYEFNVELKNIKDDMNEYKLELLVYENKSKNLSNLYNCLKNLDDIYDEQSKNSESFKDNDKFNRKYGINLLQAQENERKRIARDIHDSTVQSLTNIKHKTELITRLIDMDTIRAKLELQTMIRTIKSTIDEMRNIIYDLRPMSLDDLGLIITINRFIAEIRANYPVEISFNVMNDKYNVIPIINLTLFRIVQEATSNALKHSSASKITIKLQYNNADILLSVCDNGIGFKPDELTDFDTNQGRLSGFGLSIMKERIFLLSGRIDIISSQDSGTEINVCIPIEPIRVLTEDI